MNYYGRNDIPLGEFLYRYCFRDSYICQSCDIDMSKHQRHFVHGRQEVRISMQQLAIPIPGGDKNIFTWSTCLKCKNVSPLYVYNLFNKFDQNLSRREFSIFVNFSGTYTCFYVVYKV